MKPTLLIALALLGCAWGQTTTYHLVVKPAEKKPVETGFLSNCEPVSPDSFAVHCDHDTVLAPVCSDKEAIMVQSKNNDYWCLVPEPDDNIIHLTGATKCKQAICAAMLALTGYGGR